MKRALDTLTVAAVTTIAVFSLPAAAGQYVGFGLEYGELDEQYSRTAYPIVNLEARMGLDISDRFTIEVEGATLGKKTREFSGDCLDAATVDRLTSEDTTVGCGFVDRVSRQTLQANFIYSQPFASFDLFAGVGLGAVRTKYSFQVENIQVNDDEYSAADVQGTEDQINLILSFVGIDPVDLQVPDSVSESSIDLLYSLEGGVLIDDTHRLAVTWNPEYGSREVGKYSYVGFSYSWLFRFADF